MADKYLQRLATDWPSADVVAVDAVGRPVSIVGPLVRPSAKSTWWTDF